MPKRRCPVCRSREWHKEPSSGLITCSEGHVLQNYRNETTETTELGPHALRKRTIKSGRVKQLKQSRADGTLYHGTRARYFYFECLQLLLRKQVAALVEAWKLPPEFEIVCRDIWALHLSLLPHPPPPEPYFHAQYQAGEGASNRPGRPPTPSTSDDEGQSDSKPESSSSSSSSENDEEKGDAGAEAATGQDTLLADLLREASQSESSEDDANDARGKGATALLKGSRNRYEVPASNVAVLMLACWTMRVPAMYMDFIRLIESYTLPYLDPVRLLPPEMKRHLVKETIHALSPQFPPTPLGLHVLTSRLARLCWSSYGIHTPEVNAAPMLWRTVRAMCGTATLYRLTKSIAHVLSLPLTLHPCLSPTIVQTQRKDPKRHTSDNVPPELALVAAVTVVLKLVYGLDGRERRPVIPTDPACALPRLDDYLRTLRGVREAANEDLFSVSSHVSALDLDEGQLDLYLDFCERALLGNEEPADKTVADFFPLNTDMEDRARGEQGAAGESRVIMRPAVLVPGASDAVQPGSVMRIYNTLDILGTVPGAYAAVLEAGAQFTGLGADDVARVVERFERRLVRWGESMRTSGKRRA